MGLYPIARDAGITMYAKIARHLKQEILQNYRPGALLPPEGDMARRFGVNRHTLRRGTEELIAEGLVERRHGRGVIVTDHLLDYQLGAGTRFTETFSALGKSTESRPLRILRIAPTESVAQRLRLRPGAEVLWIETLRMAEARPLCLISHFLSADRFGWLANEYRGGSLHQLLETRLRSTLRRTESLVTAQLPEGEDARLLGIPPNRPVLRVKSLNVQDHDGMPVEYALTRFRADRVQLRINP